MGKKTHAVTMAEYIAKHGPATKRELLAACGVKPTSCGSYFAPVKVRKGYYYEPSRYEHLAKSSLVASGFLMVVGKKGRELVYGLGSNLKRLA